jgi:hypothetical protein
MQREGTGEIHLTSGYLSLSITRRWISGLLAERAVEVA